jgi:hypothetical protein
MWIMPKRILVVIKTELDCAHKEDGQINPGDGFEEDVICTYESKGALNAV